MDINDVEKYIYSQAWIPFFREHVSILSKTLHDLSMDNNVHFPYDDKIFRFTAIPPTKVTGVVIGMEPYSSYTVSGNEIIPEATGRSFEVASVTSWDQKFKQSSLRNILKAVYNEVEGNRSDTLDDIRREIAEGHFVMPAPHDWFDLMESRGIMFLNTALTVNKGDTASHLRLWAPFMDLVIGYIADNSPDACWMLFGKDAKYRVEDILIKRGITKIVITSHPRLPKFVHERPFRMLKELI